mmetsp:Transcript_50920/g.154885  ORF Transcript_50920/g.154885 Transcript_50920/m.154885 type:complete len:219 (+) Transcript_50920:276-932(+)
MPLHSSKRRPTPAGPTRQKWPTCTRRPQPREAPPAFTPPVPPRCKSLRRRCTHRWRARTGRRSRQWRVRGPSLPGTSIELRSHVLDAVPLDPNVDPLRLVGLDALLGPELVVIEREGRLVPIEALPLEAATASDGGDLCHQKHHARAEAAHAGLGPHVQVFQVHRAALPRRVREEIQRETHELRLGCISRRLLGHQTLEPRRLSGPAACQARIPDELV